MSGNEKHFGFKFSVKLGPMAGASWLQSLYSCLGENRQPGFVKKAVRKTRRLEETKRRRRDRYKGKQELREHLEQD